MTHQCHGVRDEVPFSRHRPAGAGPHLAPARARRRGRGAGRPAGRGLGGGACPGHVPDMSRTGGLACVVCRCEKGCSRACSRWSRSRGRRSPAALSRTWRACAVSSTRRTRAASWRARRRGAASHLLVARVGHRAARARPAPGQPRAQHPAVPPAPRGGSCAVLHAATIGTRSRLRRLCAVAAQRHHRRSRVQCCRLLPRLRPADQLGPV